MAVRLKHWVAVTALQENSNYKETENEHFAVSEGWLCPFQSHHELIDVKLFETAHLEDVTMELIPDCKTQCP